MFCEPLVVFISSMSIDVSISIALCPSLLITTHVNLTLAKIKLDITISKTLTKLPSSGHYSGAQTSQVCLWSWSLETIHIHVIFTHLGLAILDSCLNIVLAVTMSWAPCMKPLSSGIHALSRGHLKAVPQAVIKVYWPACGMTCIYFSFFLKDCFSFCALLLLSRTIHFICMSNWTDLND